MKSEIYNTVAAINRSFDVAVESLTVLKTEGFLTEDYVQQQTEITEEVRAGLNHMILEKLQGREREDWAHFGKLRVETEKRLKES